MKNYEISQREMVDRRHKTIEALFYSGDMRIVVSYFTNDFVFEGEKSVTLTAQEFEELMRIGQELLVNRPRFDV